MEARRRASAARERGGPQRGACPTRRLLRAPAPRGRHRGRQGPRWRRPRRGRRRPDAAVVAAARLRRRGGVPGRTGAGAAVAGPAGNRPLPAEDANAGAGTEEPATSPMAPRIPATESSPLIMRGLVQTGGATTAPPRRRRPKTTTPPTGRLPPKRRRRRRSTTTTTSPSSRCRRRRPRTRRSGFPGRRATRSATPPRRPKRLRPLITAWRGGAPVEYASNPDAGPVLAVSCCYAYARATANVAVQDGNCGEGAGPRGRRAARRPWRSSSTRPTRRRRGSADDCCPCSARRSARGRSGSSFRPE